ncbi:BnaC07g49960D [Brassica napus]|uniref:BnaC07g49960D protein n=1 Tax=Brassica napus TaxID=3708 RepID=A0A078J173_BRANA|nr:BnaC07g49960D [Brassica napus]
MPKVIEDILSIQTVAKKPRSWFL